MALCVWPLARCACRLCIDHPPLHPTSVQVVRRQQGPFWTKHAKVIHSTVQFYACALEASLRLSPSTARVAQFAILAFFTSVLCKDHSRISKTRAWICGQTTLIRGLVPLLSSHALAAPPSHDDRVHDAAPDDGAGGESGESDVWGTEQGFLASVTRAAAAGQSHDRDESARFNLCSSALAFLYHACRCVSPEIVRRVATSRGLAVMVFAVDRVASVITAAAAPAPAPVLRSSPAADAQASDRDVRCLDSAALRHAKGILRSSRPLVALFHLAFPVVSGTM